ncbi:hypothetical protein [Rossellomorea marisflavi]|nr:hypothetical protein [Rossellomorea marisflavi]
MLMNTTETIYCLNCGEDENLGLLNTFAEMDEYKCRNCGESFQVMADSN